MTEESNAKRIADLLDGIDDQLYRIADAIEALAACTYHINDRNEARAFRVSKMED